MKEVLAQRKYGHKNIRSIKIEKDKYGINLLFSKNGYNWFAVEVDNDDLEMLNDMLNNILPYK